ncbi:hypothetical protein M885DRAFT_532453 [Pelagophyceae sp. CCMP2097]|nr:hypothetical protein M885DRAFT_532453 [Pelagophyceae sp. CCMP2097]
MPMPRASVACLVLLCGAHGFQAPSKRGALDVHRPPVSRSTAEPLAPAPSTAEPLAPPPSLADAINDWGLGLKDRAKASRAAGKNVNSATLLTLFVAYRAYRGFFVVLPAVFQLVRSKLESGEIEAPSKVIDDIDPETGQIRMRSVMLMNLGAALYVVLLLLRTGVEAVFTKLFRMILPKKKASPATDAPAAAAADAPAAAVPPVPPVVFDIATA